MIFVMLWLEPSKPPLGLQVSCWALPMRTRDWKARGGGSSLFLCAHCSYQRYCSSSIWCWPPSGSASCSPSASRLHPLFRCRSSGFPELLHSETPTPLLHPSGGSFLLYLSVSFPPFSPLQHTINSLNWICPSDMSRVISVSLTVPWLRQMLWRQLCLGCLQLCCNAPRHRFLSTCAAWYTGCFPRLWLHFSPVSIILRVTFYTKIATNYFIMPNPSTPSSTQYLT